MSLRPRQDDTRREEIGIVELVSLGVCFPPTPVRRWERVFEKFNILASRYNQNWPGTDSPVLFVVEGVGWQERFYGALFLWGFHTEEECYDFLTGRGPKGYHSFDLQGKPVTDVRERLGLSDAWIHRSINLGSSKRMDL